MRKILFVLLMVLFTIPSFAQTSTSNYMQVNDNRTWINEKYKEMFPYPVTVSAYGFFNSSALAIGKAYGVTYGIGSHIGGGGAVTAKISFFRWLAIALDMSYSGASYSNGGLDSTFGTFLFSPMVVFQRETVRGQAGIVPWIGIGFSISNNSWEITENYNGNINSQSVSKGGFGFIASAGVKYNLKNNAFVGARTDYSASTFANTTMNNWRLGVEAGYRF